tara:strand:- start:10070 stop:10597 length:528 start_codon:yes stop_codon:yes gene_type:complete
MSKIRRIHVFQHSFTFSSQSEQFDTYYARFLESDLGKIFIAVPWDELVGAFGLKEYKKGPRSLFSSKGKLALMFLKHYGGCSDRKLMEQLNGNLDWQFFCDIYLGAALLDNFKMISEIRCELAKKFGKDKEYYHLKRIRARTRDTEVLWIFFGTHTGNALEIGRRMSSMALEKAA